MKQQILNLLIAIVGSAALCHYSGKDRMWYVQGRTEGYPVASWTIIYLQFLVMTGHRLNLNDHINFY